MGLKFLIFSMIDTSWLTWAGRKRSHFEFGEIIIWVIAIWSLQYIRHLFLLEGSIFWYSEVYILPDTTTFEIIQWKSDKCLLASNLHIKWQIMLIVQIASTSEKYLTSDILWFCNTEKRKPTTQSKHPSFTRNEGYFLILILLKNNALFVMIILAIPFWWTKRISLIQKVQMNLD